MKHSLRKFVPLHIKRLYWQVVNKARFASVHYWEKRYIQGGNSGAGSYGKLAAFKAEIVNEFVAKHALQTVIEFGCGDGNQLALADYPVYIGLDVAPSAIKRCLVRFAGDRTKSFFLYEPTCFIDNHNIFQADLALSLDVIYHIIEDELFELYMRHLFMSASRFVIIYGSNMERPSKVPHIKHRRISDYVAKNWPNWKLIAQLPNRYPITTDPEGSVSEFFFYQKLT